MSSAVSVSGSRWTVRGTVTNKATNAGVAGLDVTAYDKDLFRSEYLGIGVTDQVGAFEISFDAAAFRDGPFDRKPDLYFTVLDGGTELLNTKDAVLKNADASTPAIALQVDLSDDKLRELINTTPVDGWVGGFAQSNPAFAYPNPDLSSLDITGNREHIDLLQRQMKVVWPQFSWETQPGNPDSRCYQMFAPDISRAGYTNEGRIWAIICPQQGMSSPSLGTINVEVTVTGVRGWADETADQKLAADLGVEGRIWFGPSAHENPLVKTLAHHFEAEGLPFPFTKADAIKVATYTPGDTSNPWFPFFSGLNPAFEIPDFARHDDLSWTHGYLAVQIGGIKPSGSDKVDRFNQVILDIFNLGVGNMLEEGNVLSWNVWFTAPEYVDQKEWAAHAEKWRLSIDADHGSPDGDSSPQRYFDGTPFKPIEELAKEEMGKLLGFLKEHL